MTWGTLSVFISNGTLTIQDNGGYESRNKSTIRLLQEAFEKYVPDSTVTRQFTIHTEDGPSENAEYSYAIASSNDIHKSLPSFIFDCWPEVGIQNYQRMFEDIIEAGKFPYVDNRVFWIGANTNTLRKEVCNLSVQYKQYVDFRMMSWNRSDPQALHKHTQSYVSLIDHCKYRVLIDLGAGGFSARLPLLLASGRPVLLADRKYENWFYWDGTLRPWVHYIPAGSTPESVFHAVLWTFQHPEEAKKIGENGQLYAKQYLTHDYAVKRYAELLWKIQ